jgi:argininosuccinate lyase
MESEKKSRLERLLTKLKAERLEFEAKYPKYHWQIKETLSTEVETYKRSKTAKSKNEAIATLIKVFIESIEKGLIEIEIAASKTTQ